MRFIYVIFAFVAIFLIIGEVNAAVGDRFISCDLCGYCPPSDPPSNWQNCKTCIYPKINSNNQEDKETLRVDPLSNTGPTPYPGRQYTMIGCIQTDFGFSEEGAAASVTQNILKIIFSIVGAVAFLYLIYGSFVILTSQANPEKLNHGKRLVYGAVLGVIFTLTSVFIVNLIVSGILKIPGFQ